MPAYFLRLDHDGFDSTSAVQGAWNTEEQHIAPSLGLLAHVLELDHRGRHEHPMAISRISFDVLGTYAIGPVETSVRVVRPGRTIELAEATLSQNGRAAIIARAWFSQTSDTTAVAGTHLTRMPAPETFPAWEPSTKWPGECVRSVELRRDEEAPGRARFWARPRLPLLEGERVSPTARLIGALDFANGMTPRMPPEEVHFPNLDLTAYLFRAPRDATGWIGFDTTVTFGPNGHGLTDSIIHDEDGPLGAVQQTLTVRPRA